MLELRKRVTRAVLAVLVCTGVAVVFHERILRLLMEPARQFVDSPNQAAIFTELTEFIGAVMKVSMLVGIFASLPFILYQVVMFAAPGLSPSEKRYLYVLLPITLIAFVSGSAFGYLVIFPPMVRFLLGFGAELATPFISIGKYIDLMVRLLFAMGLIFEMPIITFFLSKIGVVTPEFLSRQRRYALVVAFIMGAIITPTFDPFNQSLVAAPIIVMYELSILLARLARRGRKRTSPGLERG